MIAMAVMAKWKWRRCWRYLARRSDEWMLHLGQLQAGASAAWGKAVLVLAITPPLEQCVL